MQADHNTLTTAFCLQEAMEVDIAVAAASVVLIVVVVAVVHAGDAFVYPFIGTIHFLVVSYRIKLPG